jgi:alkaline phosphatase D
VSRRDLLVRASALAGTAMANAWTTGTLGVAASLAVGCRPSRSSNSADRSGIPEPRWGVQSGDVGEHGAVVWSRSDRPSRMVVEWSTSPKFTDVRTIEGPRVTVEQDLTGRVALGSLPGGTRIHYRVRFANDGASEWATGALSTAPRSNDDVDVLFAWSADTNGQGWGIDPSRGGMPAFTALLERAPDFYVNCGDAIYGDDAVPEAIVLPDGSSWKNLVTPAKSHPAESLDDFRGAFLYARHSAEVRAASAAIPIASIWDDHEVRNNWFPGQRIDDSRYRETDVDVLAARARQAMWEHTPTLRDASAPMYRSMRWGRRAEIFLLDGRTYRTANDPAPADERFLGEEQLTWLENALTSSTATWKIIACDMPIGLVVAEPARSRAGLAFDGFANESGVPRGREEELVRLFSKLKARVVRNVVWLTADVHYAAAHRYDPSRAAFKDMLPFWEFVAGPMHAGAFPRKPFDDTFGPELVWASADETTLGSPATGASHVGLVRIDGRSGVMTVTFVDARGRDLHASVLRPEV